MLSIRYYAKSRKVRGYSNPVSLMNASMDRGRAAAVVIQENPGMSRKDHALRAFRAADILRWTKAKYAAILDREMQKLEGRPFMPTDYRIAGIGCEAFPPRAKTLLRRLCTVENAASAALTAHGWAARNFGRYGRANNPRGRN